MLEEEIRKRLNNILKEYLVGKIKDDTNLIKVLKKESGSYRILFYKLLENLLEIAFNRNILITSKGILNCYLKSDIKDSKEWVYIGEGFPEDIVDSKYSIYVNRGLFLNIIEKLDLKKTRFAYISFLVNNNSEINVELLSNKNKIKKSKDLESVAHVMLAEFDSVVPKNRRYIKFNSKEVKK